MADLKPMSCGVFTGSGSGRSSPSHFVSPPAAEAPRAPSSRPSASAAPSRVLVFVILMCRFLVRPHHVQTADEVKTLLATWGAPSSSRFTRYSALTWRLSPRPTFTPAVIRSTRIVVKSGYSRVTLLVARVERDAERVDRQRQLLRRLDPEPVRVELVELGGIEVGTGQLVGWPDRAGVLLFDVDVLARQGEASGGSGGRRSRAASAERRSSSSDRCAARTRRCRQSSATPGGGSIRTRAAPTTTGCPVRLRDGPCSASTNVPLLVPETLRLTAEEAGMI